MAEINLSKYGISGTTEIVYNPSYELLFEEETKPELEGFEKGQVSELGANEYRRISMPAAWDTGAYSSCVFLWDADTMAPLLPKMEVAKNR